MPVENSLNTSTASDYMTPEGCQASLVQFHLAAEAPERVSQGFDDPIFPYSGARARCGALELRDDFPRPMLTKAQFESQLGAMCLGCPNRPTANGEVPPIFQD